MLFEQRLRILLIVFVTGWLIVALRLFQLQVLEAADHQQRAEERLVRGTRTLEPIRGRILDRHGRVLASDEPAWSINLNYGLVSGDPDYYGQLAARLNGSSAALRSIAARQMQQPGHVEQGPESVSRMVAELKQRIDRQWVKDEVDAMWTLLAEQFARSSPEELHGRALEITQRVGRWKAAHLQAHHIQAEDAEKHPIEEEEMSHAVIDGLDHDRHIQARRVLTERFGWMLDLGAVEIADSRARQYHQAECMAHVVGQLREVTPAHIARRPYRPHAAVADRGGYCERDLIGESGIERSCEDLLRGRRGSLTTYRDSRSPDRIEAQHGQDVSLTLDYELQRRIHERLAGSIAGHPEATGGSVVVLDIPTRQVLALVSEPTYDPNEYREKYIQLSRDVHRFPLHFRAVYSQYEPGSIMKPLTILAAHSSGLIDERTLLECRGRLFPEDPRPIFRCWQRPDTGDSIQHGLINSEQAIKGSCNVFCFELGNLFCRGTGGEQMGVQRMCEWLDLFGIGRSSGIELTEEWTGILPTPSWLLGARERPADRTDARNYAIGQGELQITPVQAANLAATYAAGEYRPLTLLKNAPPKPAWKLPVAPHVWRLIRRGMYEVVNEEGGTARQYARLNHPRYVLCGKSGSAQTSRWITQYRIEYVIDERSGSAVVEANNDRVARAEFARLHPHLREARIEESQPCGFWPLYAPDDRNYSHAWFVAFLQEKGSDGLPNWGASPRIAIAVLLEFGGSGGRTSGPLCLDIAGLILDEFPQYVAD